MTNECSGAGLPDAVYAQDGLLEAMVQMIYQREAFKLQSNGSSWSKLAMGPFADHLRSLLIGWRSFLRSRPRRHRPTDLCFGRPACSIDRSAFPCQPKAFAVGSPC